MVAQIVRNLPTMQDTWVQSLGQEDPLEKGMATTTVFWPVEFHGQNLAGYSPWGSKEQDTTERLTTQTLATCAVIHHIYHIIDMISHLSIIIFIILLT